MIATVYVEQDGIPLATLNRVEVVPRPGEQIRFTTGTKSYPRGVLKDAGIDEDATFEVMRVSFVAVIHGTDGGALHGGTRTVVHVRALKA